MAVSNTRSEMTEQMFAQIGSAITQWSFVEEQLSRLMAVCLGSAVLKRVGAIEFIEVWSAMWIYYAIDNFRSRLQLVDAALTAHLHQAGVEEELRAEWDRLSLKAGRLARKRNRLAHWTVLPAQPTGTGAEHEPIAPPRLLPPIGSPGWYRETGINRGKLSLTAVQIGHLERAFHILCGKIRDFTHKVAGTEELRDRVARRALDRLLILGRLDQNLREELIRAFPSPE